MLGWFSHARHAQRCCCYVTAVAVMMAINAMETEATLLSWFQTKIGVTSPESPSEMCTVVGHWQVPNGWFHSPVVNASGSPATAKVAQRLIGPGVDYKVELKLQNIPYVGGFITNVLNDTSLAMKVKTPRVKNNRIILASCVKINEQETLYLTVLPITEQMSINQKLYKMVRDPGYVIPDLDQLKLQCHCKPSSAVINQEGADFPKIHTSNMKQRSNIKVNVKSQNKTQGDNKNSIHLSGNAGQIKNNAILQKQTNLLSIANNNKTNQIKPNIKFRSQRIMTLSNNSNNGTITTQSTRITRQINAPVKIENVYTTETSKFLPTNITTSISNITDLSQIPLLAHLNLTELNLGNDTNFQNTSILSAKTTAQKTVTVEQIVISQPKPEQKPPIILKQIIVRNITNRPAVKHYHHHCNNTQRRKPRLTTTKIVNSTNFTLTNITENTENVQQQEQQQPVPALLPNNCTNCPLLTRLIRQSSDRFKQWNPQSSKTRVTIEIQQEKPNIIEFGKTSSGQNIAQVNTDVQPVQKQTRFVLISKNLSRTEEQINNNFNNHSQQMEQKSLNNNVNLQHIKVIHRNGFNQKNEINSKEQQNIDRTKPAAPNFRSKQSEQKHSERKYNSHQPQARNIKITSQNLPLHSNPLTNPTNSIQMNKQNSQLEQKQNLQNNNSINIPNGQRNQMKISQKSQFVDKSNSKQIVNGNPSGRNTLMSQSSGGHPSQMVVTSKNTNSYSKNKMPSPTSRLLASNNTSLTSSSKIKEPHVLTQAFNNTTMGGQHINVKRELPARRDSQLRLTSVQKSSVQTAATEQHERSKSSTASWNKASNSYHH